MSGYRDPSRAGIWLYNRDESGLVSSISIIVEPCANEPKENIERREASEEFVPWEHGIAQWVFDDGKTLLCQPCGSERAAEEAREARMRRLPPQHRQWIEARGVRDWPVKEKR